MNPTKVSKFISLVLRNKPDAAGITVDKHDWANVDNLVHGVSLKFPGFDKNILEEIVRTDEKQRYSFNDDETLIRANQGHSIPVDVELEVVMPPRYLYHGTGEKYAGLIERDGLIPKSRLYVHLSGDVGTAINVGKRHGSPVIYLVDSGSMYEQGYTFYKSVNGVWLTEKVPVEYLCRQYFPDGFN